MYHFPHTSTIHTYVSVNFVYLIFIRIHTHTTHTHIHTHTHPHTLHIILIHAHSPHPHVHSVRVDWQAGAFACENCVNQVHKVYVGRCVIYVSSCIYFIVRFMHCLWFYLSLLFIANLHVFSYAYFFPARTLWTAPLMRELPGAESVLFKACGYVSLITHSLNTHSCNRKNFATGEAAFPSKCNK